MKFLYGTIRPDIPPQYIPPEMWPEYGFITELAPLCRREIVRDIPSAVRWGIWPLYFEQYVGDEKPDLDHSQRVGNLRYIRFIGWRRLREGPTPSGWHRALGGTFRVDGFQTLVNGEDFTARWHKNARRDLKLWQKNHLQVTHRIEEISWEEYAAAYKKSLIAKREGLDRLINLEQKRTFPSAAKHIIFYGVRRIADGAVVAGSASLYSPHYKSSTHYAPFIQAEARSVFASTALINHWFTESLKRGCPTVMTTNFWCHGKPKRWKGFSEFKSHFGWDFIAYPPMLWRFVRGKIW